MPSDEQRVWMVSRRPGAPEVAVVDPATVDIFEKAGWTKAPPRPSDLPALALFLAPAVRRRLRHLRP
jgi:hypothetical protein